ncbi:hypothetical protein D1007_11292 [Hordeum vulgare]|nr:hypothetical protein D1007_11292 [Hordeum vulgare]
MWDVMTFPYAQPRVSFLPGDSIATESPLRSKAPPASDHEFVACVSHLGGLRASSRRPLMYTMANALSETSDGGVAGKSDLGDFMERLNLEDEEFDDLVIEEDDPVINEGVRRLALARVHTDKTISSTAFYKDMRAAWNPAKHVRFRPIGPNLFVVQADYFGDS